MLRTANADDLMGEISRVSGSGANWELTSGKVPLEKTLAENYGQFTEGH